MADREEEETHATPPGGGLTNYKPVTELDKYFDEARSNSEVQHEIIRRADADNDGRISEAEFLQAFQEYQA